MDLVKVGKWSFLAGLVIVLLSGFLTIPMTAVILFALGLIVGFLNITSKEVEKFLLAAVALMVMGVASIGTLSILGTVASVLSGILSNLIAFVGAAALVVAIKTVVEMEK